MRRRTRLALGTLALALAATGCAPFHFDEQRLALRHDAANDRVDLLVTYANVRAHDSAKRAESEESLRRIAAGERTFLILGGLCEVDVDAALRSEDWGATWGDELEQELRAVLAALEVRAAGALDEDRGPAVWQHLRIPEARRAVAAANAALNRMLREEAPDMEEAPSRKWDLETTRAWLTKAQSGGSWIALRSDALVVSVPMSPAMRDRTLADLARADDERAEADERPEWTRALARTEYREGELRYVFEPDAEGVIEWTFAQPEWSADETPDEGILRLGWFRERLSAPERPRASLLGSD